MLGVGAGVGVDYVEELVVCGLCLEFLGMDNGFLECGGLVDHSCGEEGGMVSVLELLLLVIVDQEKV